MAIASACSLGFVSSGANAAMDYCAIADEVWSQISDNEFADSFDESGHNSREWLYTKWDYFSGKCAAQYD